MTDQSKALQKNVQAQLDARQAFNITAGRSKSFYGQYADQQNEIANINVLEHSGITSYEPTELVISARCGTRLADIEKELSNNNQMLAFEPPHFSEQATIGGCVATGLSGPRRAFSGAVRDFTLGMTLINGEAKIVHFGGEVMKNVAGYDVSRLMVGSFGTLGLILDVSLKVLPKPEKEITIRYELTERAAINRINKLFVQGIPMTASCFDGKQLIVRISGTETGVKYAHDKLGGELINNDTAYWQSIKEQTHEFFNTEQRLWRLSLAPATPPLNLMGHTLIEWRGAQRWLKTDADPELVRNTVANHGGHATIFKNARIDDEVFHPVHGKAHELHLNLKLAMDPFCIFNPGRMYPDF